MAIRVLTVRLRNLKIFALKPLNVLLCLTCALESFDVGGHLITWMIRGMKEAKHYDDQGPFVDIGNNRYYDIRQYCVSRSKVAGYQHDTKMHYTHIIIAFPPT